MSHDNPSKQSEPGYRPPETCSCGKPAAVVHIIEGMDAPLCGDFVSKQAIPSTLGSYLMSKRLHAEQGHFHFVARCQHGFVTSECTCESKAVNPADITTACGERCLPGVALQADAARIKALPVAEKLRLAAELWESNLVARKLTANVVRIALREIEDQS